MTPIIINFANIHERDVVIATNRNEETTVIRFRNFEESKIEDFIIQIRNSNLEFSLGKSRTGIEFGYNPSDTILFVYTDEYICDEIAECIAVGLGKSGYKVDRAY